MLATGIQIPNQAKSLDNHVGRASDSIGDISAVVNRTRVSVCRAIMQAAIFQPLNWLLDGSERRPRHGRSGRLGNYSDPSPRNPAWPTNWLSFICVQSEGRSYGIASLFLCLFNRIGLVRKPLHTFRSYALASDARLAPLPLSPLPSLIVQAWLIVIGRSSAKFR